MKSFKLFLVERQVVEHENAINNIIIEKNITGDVYHVTDIQSVLNILKTKKIYTTLQSGADTLSNNKAYYLSVSRSPNNTYRGQSSYPVLVLDGNKLSNNYKTTPVNYWQVDKTMKK